VASLESTTDERVFIRDKATWIGYLLIGLYCYIYSGLGPLMPYLREEQGLNYTMGSLHFSAWSVGIISAGSFGNIVIRKLGASRAIWIFGAGLCLALLSLLLAKVTAITILSVMIGGFCGSTMGQAITTINAERFGIERTIALTEVTITGSLFAMVAPLVVGQFIKMGFNWRVAMIFPFIFFVLLLIPGKAVFTEFGYVTRGFIPGKLPLKYWFFWVVIWLSVASEWSIIFWTPDFLQTGKGLLKEDAVQAVSIFLLAMLLGRVVGVNLARRYRAQMLLSVASAIALCGFLLYWLGTTTPVTLLGLGIAGLGNANVYPLSFAQSIGSAGDRTGLAAARMSISTGSAVLITPLVLAAIGDQVGIHKAHAVVAVLLTAVSIMLAIAAFKNRE